MKKSERLDPIEVFRLLGLETEQDRQRIRQLSELGRLRPTENQITVTFAVTRDNTRSEESDA